MNRDESLYKLIQKESLEWVIGALSEYAENMGETLAYRKRAGAGGIGSADIKAWKKISDKLWKLADESYSLTKVL